MGLQLFEEEVPLLTPVEVIKGELPLLQVLAVLHGDVVGLRGDTLAKFLPVHHVLHVELDDEG